MAISDRFKSAWNAFRNSSADDYRPDFTSPAVYSGSSYSRSPSRSSTPSLAFNDRYIITSIYTRISIDAATVPFRHVKLDELDRYLEDVDSEFNKCLNMEPNLDQGPSAFRQDIVMTMFSDGCCAIVPVDTAVNPQTNEVFDIYTLRVGRIVQWYPSKVKVSVYNEAKGVREDVILDKRFVAIVENPLYSVMNEPNSTLQRLVRKLSQLDAVDEQSSSGKLDIIIQLPYAIKSEARRTQADRRREALEAQLKDSQYGIAYADATEKITQLNRPAENNLMKQIEWLATMLYGQLGITEEVMNGTADEAAMINYWNRTIEPIVQAIKEAMQRSLLGRVRTDKAERVFYFRDPFRLVPLSEIAEIADKFTRNEILASNEVRGYMGIPPSKDPKADQLVNSNMPQADTGVPPESAGPNFDEIDSMMSEVFDSLEADIDKLASPSMNGSGNG